MSLAVNSTAIIPAEQAECGGGTSFSGQLGLRIAAIFIILVTSMVGTLFPILTRRSTRISIPMAAYEFAKYFGSGVIIATAFIHLLAPANEALTSPCLSHDWSIYPWAQAIAMSSVFVLFIVEVMAFRIGTARFASIGIKYHSHGSSGAEDSTHADHTHTMAPGVGAGNLLSPHASNLPGSSSGKTSVEEEGVHSPTHSPVPGSSGQLIGAAILELGVVFHSVVIGLTLAVDSQFTTFFAVVVFHQMFEGLGLGSRLSQLKLSRGYDWLPTFAGLVYSFVTPLGLAIGLGVRDTYDPNSSTALIVSGCLDSFSAGVLLYTGLVELLAHDFIFNKAMLIESSNRKLIFSIGSVLSGAALMALLGRWA